MYLGGFFQRHLTLKSCGHACHNRRAALPKPRLCLGIVRAPRPNIRPAMQPRIRSAGSTAAPFSKLTGAGRLTLFCFSFTGGYA